MSILVSKLVSVFTADTSDLKKGYDETKRGAKEVTKELKNTEHQANLTAESFLKMAKKAAGFLATAVAAGKSAQQIISEAASMVALDNFAYSIDQNIESVDAFSKAIVSLGGTTSAAESTLSSLYSKVKEASSDATSSAAEDFRRMGISVTDANGHTKDLINVLYDLSGAVEGMDASKAREYIEAIGITDRNVVEAMLQGRRELEAMIRTQKELGVVSKESAEKARAFDAAVGRLSLAFKRTKQDITDAFLPAFTWVAEKMTVVGEFINRNSTIIIGAFAGISAFLAATFIPTLWSMAAAVIAATWPFILIAGVIALVSGGIYALYEDFKFFESGQESFIGKLMDKYPFLGKAIVQVFEAIGAAADWVADTINWAMDAIGVDTSNTGGIISTVINAILGLFNKLAEYGFILSDSLLYSWGLLMDGLRTLKDYFIKTFEWIWEGIKPFIGWIIDALDAIVGPIKWVLEKLGLIDGAEVNIDHNFEENAAKRSNIETVGNFVPNIADAVGGLSEKEKQDQIISNYYNEDKSSQRSYKSESKDIDNSKTENNYYNENTLVLGAAYAQKIKQEVESARVVVEEVASNPLNTVTTNQISNMQTKNESRTYEIDISNIEIKTEATDAQGIAMGIAGALQEQLKNLEAESATGLAR